MRLACVSLLRVLGLMLTLSPQFLLVSGGIAFGMFQDEEEASTTSQDSILLQLDWEPSAWEVSASKFHSFARTPEFTLYSDGLVIFVHRFARENEPVLSVRLSPARADSVWRHVLELGVGHLESHESHSAQLPNNKSVEVFDSATSIIRVRMPTGDLRTIRNYADFANAPGTLYVIRTYLRDWYDRSATPYVPNRATLVVASKLSGWSESGSIWPLDPEILTSAKVRKLPGSGEMSLIEKGHIIDGRQYVSLINASNLQMGMQRYACEEVLYYVVLRPWFPGEDFEEEIQEYEPFPDLEPAR